MSKVNKNETLKEKLDRVLKSPSPIDILLAREQVYLELLLGREQVDAKNVQVILNGINKMGYFVPDVWSKHCGGTRLTFDEMSKITNQWLITNYILDRVKSRAGRLSRHKKIIDTIPFFNDFLFAIYNQLPLDLNHKLSKMSKREESELICLVYKAIRQCYQITNPKKEKRNFTLNQFCKLTGFIIKMFLYDFPDIGINEPNKLGKKVTSALYNTDPRLLN